MTPRIQEDIFGDPLRHADMDEVADHAMETRQGGAVIVDGVRLPLGCDYQGRWPQAAEASTEIGAEAAPRNPQHDGFGAVIWPLAVVAGIVALVLFGSMGSRLWGGA
jgi:hypothetical protein